MAIQWCLLEEPKAQVAEKSSSHSILKQHKTKLNALQLEEIYNKIVSWTHMWPLFSNSFHLNSQQNFFNKRISSNRIKGAGFYVVNSFWWHDSIEQKALLKIWPRDVTTSVRASNYPSKTIYEENWKKSNQFTVKMTSDLELSVNSIWHVTTGVFRRPLCSKLEYCSFFAVSKIITSFCLP